MTKGSFHIHNSAKRRGEGLPARLRIVARRGTTLVELLIAMLILTIVCIAWLEIIGIQSARKEARRREAVERLAGMMDAFMYVKNQPELVQEGCYYMDGLIENEYDQLSRLSDGIGFKYVSDTNPRFAVFNTEISPIHYQLKVVSANPLLNSIQAKGWKFNKSCLWLVGCLYNSVDEERPFFTLPVCLGFPKK